MACIYKIKNIENGKYYIGSTKNYEGRKKQHILQLKNRNHHNYKLQKDWDFYGEECFEFSVLEEVSDNEQFKKEQWYLDSLEGKEGEIYNICRTSYGGLAMSFHPYLRPCKVCNNNFKTYDLRQFTCSSECEMQYDLFPDEYDNDDESWKKSNYEYKDINDWDVDDFMAADFDDRWSK